MKVDLGWITSKKMQHITSGIQKLYRFVSSSVTLTKQKIMRSQIELEQEIGPSLIML
jgi:hypothetical protein